jgi:hypothetical protein
MQRFSEHHTSTEVNTNEDLRTTWHFSSGHYDCLLQDDFNHKNDLT